MRELHYGSGVVTVSFDVCSAVFDYTVALANAGRTDRITVPVLADGQRGFSNLLLGPTTQLYCTAIPGVDDETVDEVNIEDFALVESLKQKIAGLHAEPPIRSSNRYLEPLEHDTELD
ncbi:hypothetical protein B7R54_16570 [Subtercola boreus]|uniref:Uncharacterized protein n=1 Tax=Subtercola boreus TaxID=120213 RepID=A0A3E0VL66_9MICO|nr:hypothetical protein [Subtercola boreus]RFA10636.1 hypothetical protein B7R54_16570 [Subtercola boreus]TQL55807.1 hypothetical protein FB464_3381 [Subtercola boreus]